MRYIVVANIFGPPYIAFGYVKEIANGKIKWTVNEKEALVADNLDELRHIFAKVWEFSKNPEHCSVWPASLEVLADGSIAKTFTHIKTIHV